MAKKAKRKYNKESVKKSHDLKSDPILNSASLFFLIIIIVWGIFQQGFFFINDSILYQVMTCLILTTWFVFYLYNRIVPPLNYLPLLFLIIFVAFYGLSFFWAVNKVTAVEEFLKVANYLFVFMLASFVFNQKIFFDFNKNILNVENTTNYQVKNDSKADKLNDYIPGNNKPVFTVILSIIFSGLLLILVGIFFKTDPSSVTYSYFLYDRFFSLLQYPNATASYLMISFLLATGLIPLTQKKSYSFILIIISAITIAGILLTYSRGVWVTLPISCLLLLALSQKGDRLKLFLYLISPVIACLCSFLIIHFLQVEPYYGNILLLVIVASISLFLFFISDKFLSLKIRTKLTIIFSVSSIVLVFLISYAVISITGPVKLAYGTDGQADPVSIRQAVHEDIEPGSYRLSFDINTEMKSEYPGESVDPESLWQVKINGYARIPHSTKIDEYDVYEYAGGFADGWKEREVIFDVNHHLDRLEVEISSVKPGVAVEFKNVYLVFPEKKRKISFIADRFLPGSIYERFFSFSNIIAAEQRLVHNTDALKIVSDYPILGAGGGGWETLYLSYIDREYYTSEIHNHLLKIWTDSGLFALVSFLGFFICFAWNYLAWRFNKYDRFKNKEQSSLYTVLFVVILSIFAHSQIDFILSYGLFNVLFFVLAAAGFSLKRALNTDSNDEEWTSKFLKNTTFKFLLINFFILTLFLVILLNISFWNNSRLFKKAAESFNNGSLEEAALILDRFNGNDTYFDPAYALKAEIMEILASNSSGNMEKEYFYAQESLSYWGSAYRLAPFNPEYNQRLGLMMIQFGEIEEGLHLVENIVSIHPFNNDFYKQVASVRLDLAEHFLGAGQNYMYAEDLLKDNTILEEMMVYRKGNSDSLAFYMGKTYLMLGDRAAAQSYFSRVKPDDDNYREARDMLYRVNS